MRRIVVVSGSKKAVSSHTRWKLCVNKKCEPEKLVASKLGFSNSVGNFSLVIEGKGVNFSHQDDPEV